jgi:hypothetical protein
MPSGTAKGTDAMSYPVDLDEYDEERLRGEIDRRRKLRAQGLCDYCERRQDATPACKFPHRHKGWRSPGEP